MPPFLRSGSWRHSPEFRLDQMANERQYVDFDRSRGWPAGEGLF
jgi:hypothetical protein